ncbi:MAG: Tol-Pal system protein TolB, partial [Methylobacterium sp.]|nr:Tol-Pal system protein TolB [Methylobacterium sp.]
MLNPLRLLRPPGFRSLGIVSGLFACLTMPLVISAGAFAQGAGCNAGTLCIDINPRNFKPMPIAIVDFVGEAGEGAQVAGIITNNLKRSGVFEPLDRARFPERKIAFDATPNFAAWQGIGAQALLNGRVVRDGGRLAVEYRLWEVSTGKAILGQRHGVDAAAWRRLGHLASDAVFERITGETGFFDTR